ncbi:tRNA 2-selenouridine(34) synthase MnmH [Prolixibacter denitrificans]|uniref:tRNA 2-selenouridine synthase n=1 Tax=Prolixibacter denitrificans TaxID=1541063 RepID=A0A2P8CED0_9BACT|nr:tRNA 2-selenouridine(34) synthase MnmH [Prolixibacter denitrificans]PSK83333.1 tRNA 2-selenouridine synthase [Prolixibacter denitrificans]GET21786.1 tRNA 2-selenouridine(34) synthase MnmH [Prolixibacter denitrificans]
MQILSPNEFLSKAENTPVVDVRSPAEYTEGHIPEAVNIALFSNEERAEIGTIYKQQGRTEAIERGLDIIGPKMSRFVKEAQALAGNGELLVHCWRGGMRSESMAWLFERVGIRCFTLKGGYKAYRNLLLEEFASIPNLIVLEGFTGSGKTEIIQELARQGEQILDLEGLANHRGSVFGGVGQGDQPTTQQFQNILLAALRKLDKEKRIWVEGESKSIGHVFLPDPFWKAMNQARIIEIEVPVEQRVKRVVKDYGQLERSRMTDAIMSLHKRLGEQRTNLILDLYQNNELEQVAELLLSYYDKAYRYSRDKYKKSYASIDLSGKDIREDAVKLVKKANELKL